MSRFLKNTAPPELSEARASVVGGLLFRRVDRVPDMLGRRWYDSFRQCDNHHCQSMPLTLRLSVGVAGSS